MKCHKQITSEFFKLLFFTVEKYYIKEVNNMIEGLLLFYYSLDDE